jgi:hypothetical protein
MAGEGWETKGAAPKCTGATGRERRPAFTWGRVRIGGPVDLRSRANAKPRQRRSWAATHTVKRAWGLPMAKRKPRQLPTGVLGIKAWRFWPRMALCREAQGCARAVSYFHMGVRSDRSSGGRAQRTERGAAPAAQLGGNPHHQKSVGPPQKSETPTTFVMGVPELKPGGVLLSHGETPHYHRR